MRRVTFDLDVLRSFVTGMELGSFAKAADRLGRSTSAVSAQLKKLYKDKKDYQSKVQQRYDELVKQGWALPLPMLRDVVIGDAAKVTF